MLVVSQAWCHSVQTMIVLLSCNVSWIWSVAVMQCLLNLKRCCHAMSLEFEALLSCNVFWIRSVAVMQHLLIEIRSVAVVQCLLNSGVAVIQCLLKFEALLSCNVFWNSGVAVMQCLLRWHTMFWSVIKPTIYACSKLLSYVCMLKANKLCMPA